MKVSLNRIAILLGCAVAAALFASSCTKVGTDGADLPSNAAAAYTVSVNDEMLEALDIFVQFYDDEGNKRVEAITTPDTWIKKVNAKIPTRIGACLILIPKDTFDPDLSGTIQLAYSCEIDGRVLTAGRGRTYNTFDYHKQSTRTIKTERLTEWVTRFTAQDPLGALFAITPDGKTESLPWE